MICHGILKESVVAWIPTYLFETFHTDTSAAVLSTVIIPLIGLAGAYGATKLLHICGNSESGAAAIFFTVALVCFILLRALGDHSLWMTLLLFGIITAAMHGVNTLYVSLFPLRYGHLGITSSLTGLLNACTYLGTSISNYGIGAVAQFSTWNTVAILWSVFALLGVVLTLYCKNGEGKERAY